MARQHGMPQLDAKAIFGRLDTDKDGKLSFEEFSAGSRHFQAGSDHKSPKNVSSPVKGGQGMPKGPRLNDEQKAKVKALMNEFKPKFEEAANSVLTADQKKVRDNAIKTATDGGKKGPEVFKAAMSAVQLSGEQKAKMKTAMGAVKKEFDEKMKAILTPSQQKPLKATPPKHEPESTKQKEDRE
jgi:Spy/CpxP family protein refolding chaperone